MDNLDKYLNGEITKEQYEAEVAKLSPEDKAKHDEAVSSPEVVARMRKAAADELAKVAALRQAARDLEAKAPKSDFAAKLREENVEKAAQKLFSKFKIPPEDQAKYREAFSKNDSGHVDTDLIFTDFQAIYAREHADELIAAAEVVASMEQGADEFNANQGGAAGGAGGGGTTAEKRDPQVLEYVNRLAKEGRPISYEAAKRVLERGASETRFIS